MDAIWTASITAAAGTRLTQSLFSRLFTSEKKRFNLKRTLARSVTLARIAEDS